MGDTNLTVFTGRLTKDVEVSKTQNGTDYARFSIACERVKKQGEEKAQVDFINCVAWSHNAKYLSMYSHKGDKVLLEGRLQTGSYKKQDGAMVYTTDIMISRVQVLSSKQQSQQTSQPQQAQQQNLYGETVGEQFDTGDFVVSEDELPF